jgi:ankyrin repeat protein
MGSTQEEIENQLIRAIEAGDRATILTLLKTLIAAGVNLTAANNNAENRLMLAVIEGDVATVLDLITAGINVNALYLQGNTALNVAAWFGHTTVVSALIAAGADARIVNQVGQTALTLAAGKGHAAIVSTLIDACANVNATDNDDKTPLMLAASNGHTAVVSVLIASGADLNITSRTGNTALMLAAQLGYIATVFTLIEADPINRLNNLNSILILAAEYGRTAMVSALIANGANVNAVNNEGRTALKLAAIHYRFDTVLRLLSAMPFQGVEAIQHNPILGRFAKEAMQVVSDTRREIFYILSTFCSPRRILLDTKGSVKVMLSHHVPEWYVHRLNCDVEELSGKLKRIPVPGDNARAAVVVPYTPGAARRGRSSLGKEPNDNGPNSNKKARH